jgi:hypothetical protein
MYMSVLVPTRTHKQVDLIRMGDEEVLQQKEEAEAEVEYAQETLKEVGDELRRVDGDHTKVKLANTKAVREAGKDRKGGKEKKERLNRERLMEAKKYRAVKGELLLRYRAAFDEVMSAVSTYVHTPIHTHTHTHTQQTHNKHTHTRSHTHTHLCNPICTY